MKIVVTGLIATYPLGGVGWDYLAYVRGFRRLGHEVFYLEDTGQWLYNPHANTFTELAQLHRASSSMEKNAAAALSASGLPTLCPENFAFS